MTMDRFRDGARASALQTLVVKLALSFGMVFWMFLIATLSHA